MSSTGARRPRGQPQPRRAPASPWPFVGMAGLAATFFLNGAGALVAPWWGVVLLFVAWLAFFAVGCRWFTRRPRLVVVLAGADAVLWFAVLVAGAVWLGWHN